MKYEFMPGISLSSLNNFAMPSQTFPKLIILVLDDLVSIEFTTLMKWLEKFTFPGEGAVQSGPQMNKF